MRGREQGQAASESITVNKVRGTSGPEKQTEQPKVRMRPSRWHAPMWWLNIGAAVVLLITYLSPHVNPMTSWIPSVLAMSAMDTIL